MSLWRGLYDGFAHLIICHIDDSIKVTLDGLYEGEFGRYTVVRELRDYAHSWEGLLRRVREDPAGLWRQALQDIAEDYKKKKEMDWVLKIMQAVLQPYQR